MEARRVCTKCHKHLQKEIEVPIIWVIGGPGSGKGTQCDKIVEKYGFYHISTGNLIRKEVDSRSPLSKTLTELMKAGKLVPTELVIRLISNEINNHITTAKGFLIDGYPREKEQGTLFEQVIAPPTAILLFEAPEEVLIGRVLDRAKTSARLDDNEETLENRLQTYYNLKDNIIEQYKVKIKVIDADKTPNEIFKEVRKYLDSIFQ